MTPTWTLSLLVAAALAAGPAQARSQAPLLSPTSLAAPRADTNKCLADLWWGLQDSYELVVDTTKGCIGEKFDTWRFLLEDMRDFALRVGSELSTAAKTCLQKPGSCLAQLAQVARSELQPLGDLLWRSVKALITLGFSAAFELFGCIFLPAIVPFLWQTLMDLIIFGECLFEKAY